MPQAVAGELQAAGVPAAVRTWIAQPAACCEIRPDPPADPTLQSLDPGERAAIVLAVKLAADRLLIDEVDGRAEAEAGRLQVTGSLGVLPAPTWPDCSILKRRSRVFVPPLSASIPMSSRKCAAALPGRKNNHDRAPCAATDLLPSPANGEDAWASEAPAPIRACTLGHHFLPKEPQA